MMNENIHKYILGLTAACLLVDAMPLFVSYGDSYISSDAPRHQQLAVSQVQQGDDQCRFYINIRKKHVTEFRQMETFQPQRHAHFRFTLPVREPALSRMG